MLTTISLDNFKGARNSIIIPIKPLTLLFGPNSGGKSTIVQAIHYTREILERRNLDPDRTLTGGASVDLGGFLNLLHAHDTDRKMILRFDLDLGEIDFPTYDTTEIPDRDDFQGRLSGMVKTGWIEIEISWSRIKGVPLVTRYETGLNGVPAAALDTSIDGARCEARFNSLHPLISRILETDDSDDSQGISWNEVIAVNLPRELPEWGECLDLRRSLLEDGMDVASSSLLFTQMLTGPGELLRDWLRKFRYLGPLRRTIPRNYQPALTDDEAKWSDGTAAWDSLYRHGHEFIHEVSRWMADRNRLDTGYSVRLKQFREIPIDSPLLNELLIAIGSEVLFENYDADFFVRERDRHEVKQRLVMVEEASNLEMMPHDIGVGVSQILPVVAMSLLSRSGFLAIEQPELHLHPAIQARLGDLFIESALGERRNRLLLETHSEHLILRILRRIRETSGNEIAPGCREIRPEDVQVLYSKQTEEGVKLYSLPITPEGDFAMRWPDGFFEERAEELF